MEAPRRRRRNLKRRPHHERRHFNRPGAKTDRTVFAGHPNEWISVPLGAGGAGSENGRDDGGGHSPADGSGARKREGYSGGGGFEPPSRREDDGFSEGHERVCSHERSVRQVFRVGPAGALDRAGVASSEGRAGGD